MPPSEIERCLISQVELARRSWLGPGSRRTFEARPFSCHRETYTACAVPCCDCPPRLHCWIAGGFHARPDISGLTGSAVRLCRELCDGTPVTRTARGESQ